MGEETIDYQGENGMSGRKIDGAVALVTGANRGIGRAIVDALLQGGAKKVYAAARNPKSLEDLVKRHGDRLVPLKLDVTDAEQVASAVRVAGDVELVFNNAGVAEATELTGASTLEQARREMEVNYFAPLTLTQAFAEGLAARGGAVVNVSSIAGLTNFPFFPTYSASKAAVHSLTQGSRILLGSRGVAVFGVYPGPVDTDMAKDIPFDKTSPADVARAILDGIEAGQADIFPDAFAEGFGRQFHDSPKTSEEQIAAMVAEASAA
jgi:NAD(P)-dependent dehydrogenase (short-subunit alcohol dehydrogenase family)